MLRPARELRARYLRLSGLPEGAIRDFASHSDKSPPELPAIWYVSLPVCQRSLKIRPTCLHTRMAYVLYSCCKNTCTYMRTQSKRCTRTLQYCIFFLQVIPSLWHLQHVRIRDREGILASSRLKIEKGDGQTSNLRNLCQASSYIFAVMQS